jgi:hypothetical protein
MTGLGVVGGVGDRRFDPHGTFTREMAAVLLVNLLNAMGIVLEEAPADFNDREDMAVWAVTQIGQVQNAGLIQGSGGNFDPKGKFDRQSAILLMLNLWDYLKS